MSKLTDRLRDVIRPGGDAIERRVPAHDEVELDASARGPIQDAIADTLGGGWCDTEGGRYLVVDRTYGPGHRHGRVPIMDTVPPAGGVWPRLGLLATPSFPQSGRLLFFDLETTGIAGGAGTYAFLIGCGWYEGASFRTRQLLLSSFTAERAVLRGLADLAATCAAVVTFNGRTFDLPLIETRYVLQRQRTPFESMPHIDMLPPARRFWRQRIDEPENTGGGGCRLMSLEQGTFGHVRDGDVPGFEIPSRYFHFVRTNDPRPLGAVLEHNRHDLLSLAMLAARAALLLEEGPSATRTAREAMGLGTFYERGGYLAEARSCYLHAARSFEGPAEDAPYATSSVERALRAGEFDGAGFDAARNPRPPTRDRDVTRAEALRAYALLCRRQRSYGEAADAWRGLLDVPSCPPHFVRQATEALAVHHEHRARNLELAKRFALRTLQLEPTLSRRASVEHRLDRLDRKLSTPMPLALF